MPVAVVKLGSSIVAEDSGALRLSVVARICEEVAALHAGGVDVVVVTSGAIARGIHMLGLSGRPRAVEELQAASAVGQGRVDRAQPGHPRRRGILAAQVAVLVDASLLLLLTSTAGLFTADPRSDPSARLVASVEDPADLAALSISSETSALGS